MTSKAAQRAHAEADTLSVMIDLYKLALAAQNKSARTIETYTETLYKFNAFLIEKGMPRNLVAVRREHVESWIAELLSKWKPATASLRYRALNTFFKFCIEEGEIERSPMEHMKPPRVPEDPPQVLSVEDVRKMLRVCDGQTFDDRRDTAIIMLLWDCGLRRGEL